jgi:hypothetical protein
LEKAVTIFEKVCDRSCSQISVICTTHMKSGRISGQQSEDALSAIRRLGLSQIRPRQGLVNGKIAACATNESVRQLLINELDAVAKCVPLATYRLNLHRTTWKRDIQLHDFAQGRFNSQHRSDPGFADVHGMSLQHAARSRIDCDIDLNFEPGLTTGVGSKRSDYCGGRIFSFRTRVRRVIRPTPHQVLRFQRFVPIPTVGTGIRLIPWPSLGLFLERRSHGWHIASFPSNGRSGDRSGRQ